MIPAIMTSFYFLVERYVIEFEARNNLSDFRGLLIDKYERV